MSDYQQDVPENNTQSPRHQDVKNRNIKESNFALDDF